jgi:hypothetical protein
MFAGPVFVRRRPLLRAAVVGGGAFMAGRAVARRRNQEAAREASQDARISDLEQQNAPSIPSQAPARSPMLEQLDHLTALHQDGTLSDEEFTAAKTKLLGV